MPSPFASHDIIGMKETVTSSFGQDELFIRVWIQGHDWKPDGLARICVMGGRKDCAVLVCSMTALSLLVVVIPFALLFYQFGP